MTTRILIGHVLDRLRDLPDASVHCVWTSVPYWGLRSYGTEPQAWGGDPGCAHEWGDTVVLPLPAGAQGKGGQRAGRANVAAQASQRERGCWCQKCGAWRGEHGLEPTLELWLAHEVLIWREIRRVLRPDGVAWLNCGDAYASTVNGRSAADTKAAGNDDRTFRDKPIATAGALRPKQRLMMPARLAIALQGDGWWVRDEVVWCLSPSTRVYAQTATGEGPATIHDLVRLDPATVRLWTGHKWSRVLGWGGRPCADPPLRLRLRSGETINCTADHRWPLTGGRVVRADEIRIGDVLATCRLPEPDVPVGSSIDVDLAWFAGLYLAEGSMSDDAIQIAGHVKEIDREARIRKIAADFGGSVAVHRSGKTVNLVVHGAFLHAAIRHFVAGKTARNKHLHPRAWGASNAHLRALVEGYLSGDGSWDEHNDRWRLGFCRNDAWAADLRTLAARLGAVLTLNKSFAKNGRARVLESYRGEWRWQPAPAHPNSRHRAEVIAIERTAPGVFYDISIEDEPHLFALASGVLTHNCKPNPMPSSVEDRTTPAHEMLYLLTKRPRYFFDAIAIREAAVSDHPSGNGSRRDARLSYQNPDGTARGKEEQWDGVGGTRNKRSVWTIGLEPFPGAHFATAPTALVRPCILAGTSARGVCPHCGAPHERVVARVDSGRRQKKADGWASHAGAHGTIHRDGRETGEPGQPVMAQVTIGWRQTCACPAHEPVPATVLDPFGGAGTTALVAEELGRNAVLIELNPDYARMARDRIRESLGRVESEMPEDGAADLPLFATGDAA